MMNLIPNNETDEVQLLKSAIAIPVLFQKSENKEAYGKDLVNLKKVSKEKKAPHTQTRCNQQADSEKEDDLLSFASNSDTINMVNLEGNNGP